MLPSTSELVEASQPADPQAIFEVRELMLKTLANSLRVDFETLYEQLTNNGEYSVDHVSIGNRSLRNTCLFYLSYVDDEGMAERIYQQFDTANNMTDQIAAFTHLCGMAGEYHDKAISEFHDKWKGDSLVMDKWFFAQASSKRFDALDNVKSLMQHELFDIRNPNKVRSLINAFASANPVHFHAEDGSGYQFVAEQV